MKNWLMPYGSSGNGTLVSKVGDVAKILQPYGSTANAGLVAKFSVSKALRYAPSRSGGNAHLVTKVGGTGKRAAAEQHGRDEHAFKVVRLKGRKS